MNKIIKINDKDLEFSLKESVRTKRVLVTINREGEVIVTKPKRASLEMIEKFLIEKAKWIFEKSEYFKNNKTVSTITNSKKEYLENKEKALQIAKDRMEHFNKIYNFKFKNITVKNQKTRWGSCSRKGNLNFNYKIALLPEHISDYIIVHEICHLKEFNHSQRFWDLVAVTVPDYLKIRKELKGGLF
ncbi:MAG: M48 family metallopeptidase [Candidatus Nomurabacteria bacterium]